MNRDVSGGCHRQCRKGGVCKVSSHQGVGDAEGHHRQLPDHHCASVPNDGGAFATHLRIKADGGDTA